MHEVFEQRRDQEQQYPGAERAADEKPIQGNAGTGQQAFQYAGQVIGDGVRGEPDAHHDRGETRRRDLADQGETARPYRVAVCAPEPGGLFPLPALRATFSRKREKGSGYGLRPVPG